MSPRIIQKQPVVTTLSSSYMLNEDKNLMHRRRQKLCTTQRLPACFAWCLLLTPSFAYWICIFPEILLLLPKFLPISILHCILFILICANFVLATFMDPVNFVFKKAKQTVFFSRVSTGNRLEMNVLM